MGVGTYGWLYELEILIENVCLGRICLAEDRLQEVGV